MQTDSWGPHAWETQHFIVFGSPKNLDEDDKIAYTNYFLNFRCVLPCSLCRSAFGDLLKFIPIKDYIDTRDGLSYWLFIIHNLINRKLNKPLAVFDDVIYKYENMRARCGKKDDSDKYLQCKENLKEFTREEAKNKAIEICAKFYPISYDQIHAYYYSDKILDPKFQKCSV
jgi:hypothetical protein